MYAINYKLQNIAIPIDIQLKLLDVLMVPILNYSCEVWGFENRGYRKIALTVLQKHSWEQYTELYSVWRTWKFSDGNCYQA